MACYDQEDGSRCCLYETIATWYKWIKGDQVWFSKHKCVNCGHEYIE